MLPLQSVKLPLLESQHDDESTESFQLISPNCVRGRSLADRTTEGETPTLTLRTKLREYLGGLKKLSISVLHSEFLYLAVNFDNCT